MTSQLDRSVSDVHHFRAAYGPTGQAVDYVIAVGTVTGFMISFYQLGFIFSITMLNIMSVLKLKDEHFTRLNREQFVSQQYLVAFLIGLILMAFYCGTSYGYVKYSSGYINTHNIAVAGYDFAFGTSPTVVLSLLISVALFNVFSKVGNLRATIIVVSQLIINIFFVAIVGLFGANNPQLGMYAFAIGLNVGMVVNLIIIWTIAYLSWIRMSWHINLKIIRNFYKIFLPMLKVSLVST